MHGFLLAVTTALFWGALPIALKQVTTMMDPLTIVWLRFSAAALWQWGLVARPHMQATPIDWSELRVPVLFALAALGLGGNFVGYNTSVIYLSASGAQLVAQAGPLLLMLGSVVVLGERMHKVQAWGGLALVIGLSFFFNDRLYELLQPKEGYGLGILVGLAATAVWSIYGLAQKVLLREYAPATILRIVYSAVAIGLLPFAHPAMILSLTPVQVACLCFCCLNTIVAYGCFGKAMQVWHMAGVGAVLSLTPLFTLAIAKLAHYCFAEQFPNDPLNMLSYAGVLIVVLGAGMLAVGPFVVQHWSCSTKGINS